jgi:hypothetical protein
MAVEESHLERGMDPRAKSSLFPNKKVGGSKPSPLLDTDVEPGETSKLWTMRDAVMEIHHRTG